MAGLEKVDFVAEDVGFGYQSDFCCASPWEDSAGNQGRPRSGQDRMAKAEHGVWADSLGKDEGGGLVHYAA